jgi:hypothetical protein
LSLPFVCTVRPAYESVALSLAKMIRLVKLTALLGMESAGRPEGDRPRAPGDPLCEGQTSVGRSGDRQGDGEGERLYMKTKDCAVRRACVWWSIREQAGRWRGGGAVPRVCGGVRGGCLGVARGPVRRSGDWAFFTHPPLSRSLRSGSGGVRTGRVGRRLGVSGFGSVVSCEEFRRLWSRASNSRRSCGRFRMRAHAPTATACCTCATRLGPSCVCAGCAGGGPWVPGVGPAVSCEEFRRLWSRASNSRRSCGRFHTRAHAPTATVCCTGATLLGPSRVCAGCAGGGPWVSGVGCRACRFVRGVWETVALRFELLSVGRAIPHACARVDRHGVLYVCSTLET